MVTNNAKMVSKVSKLAANLVAKNNANLALPPRFRQVLIESSLYRSLVASDIEPRPSDLESDALTTRLPTAPLININSLSATGVYIRLGEPLRNLTVTCMVLKANVNVRRTSSPLPR
ncbi:hypothetical protein TNCV_2591751 [Trichonephila clavipes]|nr:hypothetical protein TNCV_2591751 [Trichonephila clavipes]